MINEKLIEKVKKLLALAASPNEEEAKLAAVKAREIIEKYCLDLKSENRVEEILESDYTPNYKLPLGAEPHFPFICQDVCRQFGVFIL